MRAGGSSEWRQSEGLGQVIFQLAMRYPLKLSALLQTGINLCTF